MYLNGNRVDFMSNFFRLIWHKTPWLTVLLVVVWLFVLGVIAKRYLNVQHDLSANEVVKFSNLESGTPPLSNGDLIQEQLNLNSASSSFIATGKYLFDSSTAPIKRINLLSETLYSSLGELHAIYDTSSTRFTLFLNQTPVTQVHTSVVEYAFQLSSQHIVLIFAAEVVGHDYVYTILDLNHGGHRIMNEVGNYEQLVGANLNRDKSCVLLRFADSRKYAEKDDYQVYQYCGVGNVAKILDVKSEEYYRSKFARLRAIDIYNLALHDGCMNSTTNSFILNRSCTYGIKYCHMYNSMISPPADQYYALLRQACQKRSNLFQPHRYLAN